MSGAYCVDCGTYFNRSTGEEWKVRCLRCWKTRKGLSEARDADALAALTAENIRLRARAARLERVAEDLCEHIPRLLQLCHPDRHGSSAGATRATQWLLAQRLALGKPEQ